MADSSSPAEQPAAAQQPEETTVVESEPVLSPEDTSQENAVSSEMRPGTASAAASTADVAADSSTSSTDSASPAPDEVAAEATTAAQETEEETTPAASEETTAAAVDSTPAPPSPDTEPQSDKAAQDEKEQMDVDAPPTPQPLSDTLPSEEPRPPRVEEQKQRDDEPRTEEAASPRSPPTADPPIALSPPPADDDSTTSPSTDLTLTSTLVAALSSCTPSFESTLIVSITDPSLPDPQPISVLIQRPYLSHPRPYLGGYRHHVSGRVKLHAETQTERRKARSATAKAERETQTVDTHTRSAQSGREVGTQMDKRGEWTADVDPHPRVLTPHPAVPSEVLEGERDACARRLQCWLRVCFSRRRMLQLRAERERVEAAATEEREGSVRARAMERERQVHRRMHPTSREDFHLLYKELSAWREHEANRIQSLDAAPAERQRQLSVLLSKEVKLLQTIDRLRIVAAQARKDAAIRRQLDQMQSPHEWPTTQGDHIEVHTPHTQRAAQLIALYHALNLPLTAPGRERAEGEVDWQGRVDVLLNIKYVVMEVGGEGVAEMVQLIEREQEWMRRRQGVAGWKDEMRGQRQRLAALFLHFIQLPAVNPAAGVYNGAISAQEKAALQRLLAAPQHLREAAVVASAGDRVVQARVQP